MSETIRKTAINIELATSTRVHEVDFSNLQFGRMFGDHMFEVMYENGLWGEPIVKPYGNIDIAPAMNVFHYGQAVFEGMKAFYKDEKTINIFRPQDHHARFNRSCRRMCIPETEYEVFISALETLIKLDKKWVPQAAGTAMYIRPFIFASEEYLAARISDRYSHYIITSPAFVHERQY